jgi:HAMP domain-containing protein
MIPLGPRAPVAAMPLRDCESCQAPMLPRSVCASDKGRPYALDERVSALMKKYVHSLGSKDERAARFAHDMMQLRLDRFFPKKVNLSKLRQEEEDAHALRDKAPALRHLLSVRRAICDEYGPEVAVHPYFSDPTVRYSMMWRLAPDEYRVCNATGRNISITRLAFQPVHDKIESPLWQLRLEDAREEDWNPNAVMLASPLKDKRIPDPSTAIDQTFEDLMSQLALILHLGWQKEEGDYILLEHMQQGLFAVRRARSEYEEHMDARAFSYLLYRVAEAAAVGNATLEDGVRVLVSMAETGLAPAPADFHTLMTVAVGVARHGQGGGMQDVDNVLDLMARLGVGCEHWLYLVAFEALAWAARHGHAGVDESEALLIRMLDPDSPPRPHPVPHDLYHARGPLQDADLYAALLAVVAASAQRGSERDTERMQTAYHEDEDGMVVARELAPGEAALTWQLLAEHVLGRMRQESVPASSLVHHARMQVAVGSARRGEVGWEEVEGLIEAVLGDDVELDHHHAHSLLAAAAALVECGRASLNEVALLVDYIGAASLEFDALCYSLWLRAMAHEVARGASSFSDLLAVLDRARDDGMTLSGEALDALGEAVAAQVGVVVEGWGGSGKDARMAGGACNCSLAEVRGLQAEVALVFERLLFLGASPPKALFDARLLLVAVAAEVGDDAVSGLEGECCAEDMMVAGHAPDALTLCHAMRLLASTNARGQTGVTDVVRILERAIAARVNAHEDLLVELLFALQASASLGSLSLADAGPPHPQRD